MEMIKERQRTLESKETVTVNGKDSELVCTLTQKADGNFKVASFITTKQVSLKPAEMKAIFKTSNEMAQKLIDYGMERMTDIKARAKEEEEANDNQVRIGDKEGLAEN